MTLPPSLGTPYDDLGGEDVVRRLATRFYDVMERDEPALLAVHLQDPPGHVALQTRERFGLFLMGWLGGPQTYQERFGHPRLRMRHAHVQIDQDQRDAWLRCMVKALDDLEIRGDTRAYVETRLAEVATFLKNVGA